MNLYCVHLLLCGIITTQRSTSLTQEAAESLLSRVCRGSCMFYIQFYWFVKPSVQQNVNVPSSIKCQSSTGHLKLKEPSCTFVDPLTEPV